MPTNSIETGISGRWVKPRKNAVSVGDTGKIPFSDPCVVDDDSWVQQNHLHQLPAPAHDTSLAINPAALPSHYRVEEELTRGRCGNCGRVQPERRGALCGMHAL
jgi:hypothetical protein